MARPQLSDIEILKPAILAADRGCKPKEICDHLKISKETVSKRLATAKARGWIRQRDVLLLKDNIDADLLNNAKQSLEFPELHQQLREAFPDAAVSISPTPTTGRRSGARAWKHKLEAFAEHAAPVVANYLRSAEVIGVSSGRTVGHVIDAIKSLNLEKPSTRPTVFPTGGEPIDSLKHDAAFAGSALALSLATALHGNTQPMLGVPFALPAKFKDNVPVFKEFFEMLPRYKEALSLIKQMDTALIGADGYKDTHNEIERDREKFHGLKKDTWTNFILGDIGGCLVPDPDNPEAEVLVNAISERSFGVTLNDYRACYKRAKQQQGANGVILVAHGSEKVDIVRAALKYPVVNKLIIDHDLARALCDDQ